MSMQLTYNTTDSNSVSYSCALHNYGDIQIVGERRDVDNQDNPQEYNVTLTVKVIATQDSYNENRERMAAIHTALSIPKGTLTWADSESGVTYLSARPVTAVSSDLPEDPNSVGTWRQEITITFKWSESVDKSEDTLKITYTRTGSTSPIELGYVTSWKEGIRNTRFTDFHGERSSCVGSISASGALRADSSMTLTQKRVALQAEQANLMLELNGKTGILIYGVGGQFFNRTVKIDEFTCDVDQAEDKILWSLSATFTRFPDEAGYAVAEYTASTASNNETGEETLSFNGRIGASTSAVAAAKLSQLDSAVKTTYGYTSARQIRSSIDYRHVSVSPPTGQGITLKSTTGTTINDLPNADNSSATDATFIELSFDYAYLKRSTDLKTWNLKVSSQEDVRSGLNTVTYSGTVIAGGATKDAAYNTAIALAVTLAAAKHQMLVSQNITAEYKRTEAPAAAAGLEELVSLEFNYTYLVKMSKYYFEVNEDTGFDTGGDSVRNISGFVSDSSKAAAETKYKNSILAGMFNASRIRNERTSWTKSCIQQVVHGDDNRSPDTDVSGSTELPATSGYHTQEGVLNFSFQIVRERSQAETAMKYSLTTSFDYASLEKTIRITGTVTSSTAAYAQTYLDHFFNLSSAGVPQATGGTFYFGTTAIGTSLTGWEMTDSSEYDPIISVSTSTKVAINNSSASFGSLSFSGTFVSAITGESGIIEAEMSEDIKYVGTRYVNQDIVTPYTDANGHSCASVVQNTGEEAGSRTVSGTVTAATEAIAMAWVKKVYHFPFPTGTYSRPTAADADTIIRYPGPVQISVSWRWLPRISSPGVYDVTTRQWTEDGKLVTDGGDAMTNNAKVCQVRFSFTEILNCLRISL